MAEWTPSNYKADEKEAARNRKKLMKLIKLPDNAHCADCPTKLAQNAWASINLGEFICFQCSGIHRNLGTHITKVRSLNLDSWNDDWVANMERWGNGRCAGYWEARIPPGVRRPTTEDSNQQNHVLKTFIKDKYQDRIWAAAERPTDWIQANGGAMPTAPAPARVSVPVSKPAAPAAGPDLFSFDEPVAAPAPAPAAFSDPFGFDAAPAPAPAPAPAATPGGFGDFGDQGGSGGFGDFGNAGQAQPQPDKKDNIMNMFNTPQQMGMGMQGGMGMPMGGGMGMPQQQMGGMQQMQMGMQNMQMGGMRPGMGMPGQMGMPQQQMGGMGMPQQQQMGGMGMPQQQMGMGMQGGMRPGMQPMGGMGMPQQQQMGGMGGMGMPQQPGGWR